MRIEIDREKLGQIVLVLQGGGALGAYQAGVYQALHEAGIEPDWVIGTSIGAINAGLIAGKFRASASRSLTNSGRASQSSRRLQTPTRSSPPLLPMQPRSLAVFQASSSPIPPPGSVPRQGLARSRPPITRPSRWGRRLRPDVSIAAQCRPSPPDRRRRQRANGRNALFRQPRDHLDGSAYHGVGRPAAGLPGDPDRRRTVLGRRHTLQYAGRSRVRRQPAPKRLDLRGAYVGAERS